MENLKSWAVTGLPSWNLTSFLRWKVKVRSSLLRSHLVAMSGTMLRSASMVTRPLKTSMTTNARAGVGGEGGIQRGGIGEEAGKLTARACGRVRDRCGGGKRGRGGGDGCGGGLEGGAIVA